MLTDIENTKSDCRRFRGVTLIELLVVISIITVMTAIMVPRLRMISKDRNIREAARVAGSLFSNASQRAINEGAAGVIIERNANMVDANGVYYGATSLYLMRKVPPFIGDSDGDEAVRIGDYILEIDEPFEQAESGMVLVNDSISVNNGSVRYRIDVVDDTTTVGKLRLELSNDINARPELPGDVGDEYSFVVHRQPRKLESSRVDMPEGYLIDMRYSGPLNPGADPVVAADGTVMEVPRCWFHEIVDPDFYNLPVYDPIKNRQARTTTVIFDDHGGIDRLYFYNPSDPSGTTPNGFIDTKILANQLYLFVTNYEINPGIGHLALNSGSSLWVVIDQTTGGVNIAYNTPAPGGTLSDRIINSRGIARNSQNANQ